MSSVVRVRYFAAARAAAGSAEEELAAGSVAELVTEISERHGPRMASVLTMSSLLVDGQVSQDPSTTLDGVTEVDVLPPFAGG